MVALLGWGLRAWDHPRAVVALPGHGSGPRIVPRPWWHPRGGDQHPQDQDLELSPYHGDSHSWGPGNSFLCQLALPGQGPEARAVPTPWWHPQDKDNKPVPVVTPTGSGPGAQTCPHTVVALTAGDRKPIPGPQWHSQAKDQDTKLSPHHGGTHSTRTVPTLWWHFQGKSPHHSDTRRTQPVPVAAVSPPAPRRPRSVPCVPVPAGCPSPPCRSGRAVPA